MKSKVFLYSISLYLLLSLPENLAFKIPRIHLELLNERGFELSIPDETAMQGVLYVMQIDDSCPPIIDYITRAVNGTWKSKMQIPLQNNDKLQITVVVQYNDVLYEKTETRVLLNTRLLTTRESSSHTFNYPNETQCRAILDFEEHDESTSCQPALSVVDISKSICKGQLLFEDNFGGSELNRSVWTYDVRQRMYHVEEELVAFDDGPRNSFLKKGNLHILPTVAAEVKQGGFKLGDRCTALDSPELECNIARGSFYKITPPAYSAQLHTRKFFSFKYGKIEVRAKLPKGDWLFPYIMLQPVSTNAETHYANQLRIASARGNAHLRSIKQEDISGHRLYGGMIVWEHEQAVQLFRERLSEKHYGDEFHNYTMIWKPDSITLMVDNEIYGEIFEGLRVFNERCFIIIGVTVGGFLNFDDSIIPKDVKPYKNREPRAALAFWQGRTNWAPTWTNNSAMLIDYVRVYAE